MFDFKTKHAAYRWLLRANAGITYISLRGCIRGYDPTNRLLYVVAEIDPTPMTLK